MTFNEWFNENTEYQGMTEGMQWGAWKTTLERAYNAGFKEGYRLGENNSLPDFDDYPD